MESLREQIRSMVRVEPREGGFRAVLTVDPKLSVLPDHFPARAILPGMCMVQAVLVAAAAARGVRDLRLTLLKNAKFMHPVVPGDQVVIEGRMEARPDGTEAIKAKLSMDERAVAEFSLQARRPEEGEERP
jgi:3-hydroxymyristoyl/3-hydroxydecanoyl-(acyl carrier protein) dehydratase